MRLVQGRAVYWPREATLLVADLHLEKASFFATVGQLLPPYDSRETLERLALAIRETGARRVFALGDNFHDRAGVDRLDDHTCGMLAALTRAVDWVWIAGNHDGVSAHACGGAVALEVLLGGVRLRHRAEAVTDAPEVSGHYHPKLAISAGGRRISRPCAVLSSGVGSGETVGESRMILPAFGALTGGMHAGDPAILAAMQPARHIEAIVPAAGRLLRYPLWRHADAN
jgi:DNA ligase-associated metallophosphoesterase